MFIRLKNVPVKSRFIIDILHPYKNSTLSLSFVAILEFKHGLLQFLVFQVDQVEGPRFTELLSLALVLLGSIKSYRKGALLLASVIFEAHLEESSPLEHSLFVRLDRNRRGEDKFA